MDKYETL